MINSVTRYIGSKGRKGFAHFFKRLDERLSRIGDLKRNVVRYGRYHIGTVSMDSIDGQAQRYAEVYSTLVSRDSGDTIIKIVVETFGLGDAPGRKFPSRRNKKEAFIVENSAFYSGPFHRRTIEAMASELSNKKTADMLIRLVIAWIDGKAKNRTLGKAKEFNQIIDNDKCWHGVSSPDKSSDVTTKAVIRFLNATD